MRADKDNLTVTMDQDEYKQKMRKMLRDISIYTVINRDPIRKLTESVRILLKWKNCGYINSKMYKNWTAVMGSCRGSMGFPRFIKIGAL